MVLESILRPAPWAGAWSVRPANGPPSRAPPPDSGPSPCRPRSSLFLSLDALSAAAGPRAGPLWGGASPSVW